MKYKSKLKRNSKYNPHSKRFKNHKLFYDTDVKSTCTDKITYYSRYEAKKAKCGIENRTGGVARIYKCKYCTHYHLTSAERYR